MRYPDSVRFLYALGNEIKTAKFGLERIRILLNALGNPERDSRFVHVAGTNGKGSTCAMIEAGLRAAGQSTGLYISPHLQEPTERIQVRGEPVAPEQFAGAFDRVHETAERLMTAGEIDMHPTYFESVTAMAFLLFRDLRAGNVVLETGLGGRLDATNVVNPDLCVITPVDFDHEQFLGNTLALIAGEKAGILKPGVAAVVAEQRPEAAAVIEARARELGARVIREQEAAVTEVRVNARSSTFCLDGEPLRCPLAGAHQVQNAVTAALALRELGVSSDGIARTVWPGRLEWIGDHPPVILDGAHNPAGARALADYIREFFMDRRVWMIYGTMRDKSVEEILDTLFPLAHEVIATAPKYARSLRPEAIVGMAHGARIRIAPDLGTAIDLVRREARTEDVVFITGSLFVVGEARALLLQ